MNLIRKKVEENRLSETQYRSIKNRLSYSSIKLFDTDRRAFYSQIVMGEQKKDKESISLVLGSLVHCLLSGGEDFHEKYHIASAVKPSGQMGLLIDNLIDRSLKSMVDGIQTDKFSVLFGDAFIATKFDYEGNEIAFKKKELPKVLEMFEGTDAEIYYNECLETIGKTVVSIGTIENAERLVEKIKSHRYTSEYANAVTEGDIEVFNELPVLFEIADVPYKAMLDKIIVDHSKKQIEPVDWKTSWDNENPEAGYTKYGYYLQASMYNLALLKWQVDHKLEGYKVLPMRFVFIDTTGFNDPVLLGLSQDDLDRAMRGFTLRGFHYNGLQFLMDEITWCVQEGIWTTTRELNKCNGVYKLRLKYGSR